MKSNPKQGRLARLQSECDVSVGPAVLLFVASALLVVILAASDLIF